jgi:hypothetical protein
MKHISSFVKWAFVVAFVIITNLFFHYTISFIASEPKYENFCQIRSEMISTAEMCVTAGGQWTNFPLSPKEITEAVKTSNPTGWCDADFTCRGEFESRQSVYNKNVFVAMIVISVALVAVGMFMVVQVLSLGMVWSGVLALIIATIRFWNDASNIMKVIILGLGIAILVWLAIKKMQGSEK